MTIYQGTPRDDLFRGSGGNDTFNGGNGFDTVDYSSLGGAVGVPQKITLLPSGRVEKGISGGFGTDQLNSIEKIIANSNANNNLIDASTAAAGASISVNLSTSNLIVRAIPGLGNLTFEVVNFDDVIGTDSHDIITGDSQNNALRGRGGNDILNGGAGNDFLNGGEGDDSLTGGSGVDTFVYNSLSHGGDTITDFLTGERIRLDASNFTGLKSGDLSSNRYGEGSSLVAAAFAAITAGAFNAAILAVGSGSGVRVFYTANTRNTFINGGDATLLATLTGQTLAGISEANFSIVA